MQVLFKKFLQGCRLVFPHGLLLLRLLFSTHFYLLVFVAQRMERFSVSALHVHDRRAENFVSSRIDFLNVIVSKTDREQIRRFKRGIMSASDSKAVVDHVSDLSSSKEPILFVGFLFLQTDLLLEVGILDDLIQSRSNSCVQHFKIREILSPKLIAILIHPLSRPSPLL